MAEVVRRERRHAGGPARSRNRRAEAVGAEALEDAPLGCAIVARDELDDGREDRRRHLNPAGTAGLARRLRHAPAAARLVDVGLRECLELTETHAGRVEHEQRQPAMPNWRYLIDSFPGRLPELNESTLEEFLNMRGNQAWELIHFGRLNESDVELIFKQPA